VVTTTAILCLHGVFARAAAVLSADRPFRFSMCDDVGTSGSNFKVFPNVLEPTTRPHIGFVSIPLRVRYRDRNALERVLRLSLPRSPNVNHKPMPYDIIARLPHPSAALWTCGPERPLTTNDPNMRHPSCQKHINTHNVHDSCDYRVCSVLRSGSCHVKCCRGFVRNRCTSHCSATEIDCIVTNVPVHVRRVPCPRRVPFRDHHHALFHL
jgi:hypothetical protein